MFRRLSAWLLRMSSGWTLAAATAAYVYFLATVMPAQSAASQAYAGAWGAPDRHLFFTPDELYGALALWGAEGRQDYIDFRLGLDIAWAVAYTAFLVLAIGCASRVAFRADDRRRLLNVVPLATMLLDYTENALGIFLAGNFPARHDAAAWATAVVTAGKWLTLLVSHGVLVYVLVLAARARWGRRAFELDRS